MLKGWCWEQWFSTYTIKCEHCLFSNFPHVFTRSYWNKRVLQFDKYAQIKGIQCHQLFSLCSPGDITFNVVGNSMIFMAERGAVWQQIISIIPKVDISGACESLGGVWRHTGAPECLLRMMWGEIKAVVPVLQDLLLSSTCLLCIAQFRVAKSPNHAAEVEEKCAHNHDHECVGLNHGFSDWGWHRFSAQE